MIYSPEESSKRRDFFNAFADCILDTLGNVFEYYKFNDESKLIDFYYKDIGIKEGDRILDVGCGTGIIDIKLSNFFNDVKFDGIDISDNLLDKGYNLINASGVTDKVRLQQGDFHYLSTYYPENYFDKVILLESFSYATNKGLLLKEIKKILKPNGQIYIKDIFVPNKGFKSEEANTLIENFILELKSFTFLNITNIQEFLNLFLNSSFILTNLKEPELFLLDKETSEKRIKLLYKLGVNVYNYKDLFKRTITINNNKRPLFLETYCLKFSNVIVD
jgi:ubiquinone/menaquinone biosynthesis C-methylase UbiE